MKNKSYLRKLREHTERYNKTVVECQKIANKRLSQHRNLSKLIDTFLEENRGARVYDTNLLTFHTWSYKRINEF